MEKNDSQEKDPATAEKQRSLERIDREMETEQWETKIIFQRHSRYDNGFPSAGWGKHTDSERSVLGKLTEEGRSEARTAATERISRAIESAGSDVDFLVVASPTRWLGDSELGQRAVETADIIKDEIKQQLDSAGLSEDQLLDLSPYVGADSKDQYDKLVEATMFDNQLEFVDELRKKYGGQNRAFWDAYNADADRERRLEAGAEGSHDVAERAHQFLDILARWAKLRRIEAPQRKTVIFVVSHHEVLEPYALHKLGAEPGDFQPQYNDGIEINIDSEGVGRTTIAGKAIEVTFAGNK